MMNVGTRRRMKIMLLISHFYGRGLIYQALARAIHLLGLMNQTPTSCARAFTRRRMKTGTNELAQHIGPPL